MRVVRDAVGNVSDGEGVTVYANVRYLTDDQKRVAVFTAKGAPVHVYGPDEVTTTVTRKPCACKGDWPKGTLKREWMNVDKVNA